METGNNLSFRWLHWFYCTILALTALKPASSAHPAGSATAYSTRSLRGMTDQEDGLARVAARQHDERIYGRTHFPFPFPLNQSMGGPLSWMRVCRSWRVRPVVRPTRCQLAAR